MIEIVGERLAIIGSYQPYGGRLNAKLRRDHRNRQALLCCSLREKSHGAANLKGGDS
jgi:hypothetical protein